MRFLVYCVMILNFYFLNLSAQISWIPTAEINGGIIHSLASNSLNHIFAATDSGIFRTTNNGLLWTKSNLHKKTVHSILIYSDSVLYAGTRQDGIYTSIDGGINWSYNGLSGHYISSFGKNSEGHIFVGDLSADTSKSGVYRSIDNGLSWIRMNQGLTFNIVNVLAVIQSDYVIASTFSHNGISSGIYRTTDNGNSWIKMHSTGVVSFGVHPNSYIFAGATGIILSKDDGENWMHNFAMPVYPNAFGFSSDGHVFCGTNYDGFFDYGGVFWSEDTGNTWIEVNEGLENEDRDIFSLTIDSQDIIYIGTRNGRIFKTYQHIPHF